MNKKSQNIEEYIFAEHKLFWIEDNENEEDVLEQIKKWVNTKTELEGTIRLALVNKDTFNKFYNYIQKLKEGK